MSYAKIAKKYQTTEQSVYQRSRKESWVKLRENIELQVSQQIQEKIVDDLAEINTRHGNTWKLFQRLAITNVSIVLEEVEAEKKAAELAGVRLSRRDILGGKAFADYAAGMKIAIDGERVTVGLPTNVTKTDTELTLKNEFARYTEEELKEIIEDDFTSNHREERKTKQARLTAS